MLEVMGGAPPPTQQQPAQQEPPKTGGSLISMVENQFDPEEKTMFFGLLKNARKTINEQSDAVEGLFENSKDPITAAGQVAGLLVYGMVQSALGEQNQLRKKPVVAALQQVTTDLLELGQAQGKVSVGSQQEAAQATQLAARTAGNQYVSMGRQQRQAMDQGGPQGAVGQPPQAQGQAPRAPVHGGGMLSRAGAA